MFCSEDLDVLTASPVTRDSIPSVVMSRGLCKVRVVEGRVGEELSFASQKTRRVASRCGFYAHARRGVGAEVGVLDGAEGVGVFLAEVGLDAAQGEVHDGEAAGGGVALFRLLPRSLTMRARFARPIWRCRRADLSWP